MAVEIAPITDTDLSPVARFMHENLNPRVPVEAWASALEVPWTVASPNRGFMLLDDGALVGAYLAYYSDRVIDDRLERFCNLGAWCVLEEHRFRGLRLLKALLDQPDYHFTDLSPSGNVIGLNKRLKFEVLDTSTALVPNLPWPSVRRRCHITCDPLALMNTLTGSDLAIYRDHQTTAAARHMLMTSGDEHCYVILRKDRRKGLPVFASILHVGNPDLFRKFSRELSRYVLFHHGAVATLAELRVVGGRPTPSMMLSKPRPKMFKSPTLTSDRIDYLYSELTCLAW